MSSNAEVTLPSEIQGATTFRCSRLASFDPNVEAEVRSAFENTEGLPLSQSWLPSLQTGFRPGIVRVGWTSDFQGEDEPHLWVWAQLESLRPPSNQTRNFGEPTWEMGDVFEVFLQPPGDPYFELHVTPEKFHLALEFPYNGANGEIESDEDFVGCLRPGLRLSRWSWLDEKDQGVTWNVLMALRLSELDPQFSVAHPWRASFCRYDVSSAEPGERFLSSSSPLSLPKFHRVHEWNRLVFED